MSLGDAINYLAFGNPVSKKTITGVSEIARWAGIRPKSSTVGTVTKPVTNAVEQIYPPLWKQMGGNSAFIRLAALSGASAVCLAAYGRHKIKDSPQSKDFRHIYESASNMHIIHSVVLLALPLARRPALSGTLFTVGMLLFSGSCYYKAIKKSNGENGDLIPANVAPLGGACLILGWLSLLL